MFAHIVRVLPKRFIRLSTWRTTYQGMNVVITGTETWYIWAGGNALRSRWLAPFHCRGGGGVSGEDIPHPQKGCGMIALQEKANVRQDQQHFLGQRWGCVGRSRLSTSDRFFVGNHDKTSSVNHFVDYWRLRLLPVLSHYVWISSKNTITNTTKGLFYHQHW